MGDVYMRIDEIGEPYMVNGLYYYDEFDRDVELKSSFYSKTYAVFASYFTFCKEAVFGRPVPTSRYLDEAFDLNDEYFPGNGACDFEFGIAEPTPYERISRYIYSIYERMVRCFYRFFGIDD